MFSVGDAVVVGPEVFVAADKVHIGKRGIVIGMPGSEAEKPEYKVYFVKLEGDEDTYQFFGIDLTKV